MPQRTETEANAIHARALMAGRIALLASRPLRPPPGTAPRADHSNQILVVLLLAGVSFALSQTLVVPALTAIGKDMHACARPRPRGC